MEGSHGELPDRVGGLHKKMGASNKKDEIPTLVHVVLSPYTFTII